MLNLLNLLAMIYKYIIGGLSYHILNLRGNKDLKNKYLLFLLIPFVGEIIYDFSRWKRTIFSFVSQLPYISQLIDNKIAKEMNKIRPGLIEDRYKHINKDDITLNLPLQGKSDSDIMKQLNKIIPEKSSKISGALYTKKENYSDMIGYIYKEFSLTSPTHPDLWPSLNQMRAEVYSMCCNLFYGSTNSCAVFTAGGTLSIIQALYTYRKWGKDIKGITQPNIIVPSSAHASFRKGCDILGIEFIMIPVCEKSSQADAYRMKNAINTNTIMIVGSAPSFPCGIIDPIGELGEIAFKHKIGFHVDACLGGFQLPFVEKAGYVLEEYIDFRNPYITSISADLHKFGKVPKGASILMFSNKSLRDYLTYVDLQWEGGLYVTPGFPGSESGATIIAAWVIMMMTGEKEYVNVTRKAIHLCRNITKEISFIEDVYVVGTPILSTFAIKSDTINIHFVGKKMHENGWELNSLPNGLHFCMGELQTLWKKCEETFIKDLTDSISYVKSHPEEDPGDTANIYCSTQKIPSYADELLDKIGRMYIDIQTSNEIM